MRLLMVTVAIVMLASFVGVDRVVPTPLQAADRVAEVLSAAKKALGGEDKLAAVKGISAEGPFRRSMGQRDMEGNVTLLIVRPDKYRQIEELQIGGMVGGPSIERTSVLAGTKAWDDVQNRGAVGGGGGMRMEIRTAPPPPPPGASGAAASAPTQEQIDEARVRRMKIQLSRYMTVLFAEGPQAWVDAGIAESPEGKADILEATEENGRKIRLFIDQATHLPLMVQYQDPKPMIMMQGGPGRGGPGGPGGPGGGGMVMVGPGGGGGAVVKGGADSGGSAAGIEKKAAAMAGTPQEGQKPPTPEEMQKRVEEMRRQPPQIGTYSMHLAEYKKVDGVMLPHKIDTDLDGQPNEEWTIEKYKLNPSVKADVWEKK